MSPLKRLNLNSSASLSADTVVLFFLVYAVARFLNHYLVYAVLAIFLFYFALKSFKRRIFLAFSAQRFYPILFLTITAIPWAVMQGANDAATYFFFYSLIFWCIATGDNLFTTLNHKRLRFISMIFVLLVLPFVIDQHLQDYGSFQRDPLEIERMAYDNSNEGRLYAFFYHTNELGIFCASLLVLLIPNFKRYTKNRTVMAFDAILILAIFFIVLLTKSTTAEIVILYALAKRISDSLAIDVGIYLCFATQFITQLFLPQDTIPLISSGSLIWRYQQAVTIEYLANLVSFRPEIMAHLLDYDVQSWPHSFLLDLRLSFGTVATILAFILLSVPLFSRKKRELLGWNSIFWVASALQPIGAMPAVYIPLAAVCVYAANRQKNTSGLTEPQTKKILHPSLVHGLALVLMVLPVTASAQNSPPPTFKAKEWFAENSPWFAPISTDTNPAEFGEAAITAFRAGGGSITLNLDLWTTTVLTADTATPRFDLGWGPWRLPQVPVPPAIFPALEYLTARHDTDRNFCIVDPTHYSLYTFWAVAPDPARTGSITVKAGGLFSQDGAGWNDNTKGPWSGRASGASTCGGLITPEEMQAGVIPHALAAGWPHDLIRSDKAVGSVLFPASTTDGGNAQAEGSLPMGTRLQLDPALTDSDLRHMGLQSGDLVIAHALQKYGAYIVDSSSTFSITFVSGLGHGRDLYPNVTGSWPHAIMAHIHATQPPLREISAPLERWQGQKSP